MKSTICTCRSLLLLVFLLLFVQQSQAQFFRKDEDEKKSSKPKIKVYQSTSGMLVGYQRGKVNFFELGAERNWRRIRLVKPRVFAISGTAEYNLWHNTMAIRVGAWRKVGRLRFTYGLHGGYFTDFDGGNAGFGPAIGFKLLGFHGQLGYNYLIGQPRVEQVNSLYMNLRYFIPLHSQMDVEKNGKRSRLFKF